MKVNVLCFGVAREIIGKANLNIELHVNAGVDDLLKKLKAQYPELSKLSSLAVAVNNEYVKGNFAIQENDEIALIPPVSGG